MSVKRASALLAPASQRRSGGGGRGEGGRWIVGRSEGGMWREAGSARQWRDISEQLSPPDTHHCHTLTVVKLSFIYDIFIYIWYIHMYIWYFKCIYMIFCFIILYFYSLYTFIWFNNDVNVTRTHTHPPKLITFERFSWRQCERLDDILLVVSKWVQNSTFSELNLENYKCHEKGKYLLYWKNYTETLQCYDLLFLFL